MALHPIALSAIASVLASGIPTLLYVVVVLKLDRFEREPARLLVAAFFWGAAPAVLGALLAETAAYDLLAAGGVEDLPMLFSSYVAPPLEECLKALGIAGIFILARHEFDGALDGVVYGSLVGFGFGMTENALHYAMASTTTPELWSSLVLSRGVAFGLNHAMFSAMTGIGFALARSEQNRRDAPRAVVLGLLAATIAHLFHNLFLNYDDLCWLGLVIDWTGVGVLVVIVVLSWHREREWLSTELPPEVDNGVLSQGQYETIISWKSRTLIRFRLMSRSESAQLRLWQQFRDAAANLAFAKHHERVGAEPASAQDIAGLRQRLADVRARWESGLV